MQRRSKAFYPTANTQVRYINARRLVVLGKTQPLPTRQQCRHYQSKERREYYAKVPVQEPRRLSD
nr:MAG TPA: hypothetical protein [Caudoviricetes sp.]